MDFAPENVEDLDAATKEQLIAYLTTHKVAFGEKALKPELLGKAREHFTTEAAKPDAGPVKPALIAPSETSQEEALTALEKKGFADKDEIVHMLNALERKEAEVKNIQIDIDKKVALIETKDIEFEAREAAIKRDVEKFVALNHENDLQLQELNKLQGKGPK